MQERLTTKDDWRWNKDKSLSPLAILKFANDKTHWAFVARSFYDPKAETFIELGCAPGDTSAILTIDSGLRAYGVDFSDDSALYLEKMQSIGKQATLYHEDIFRFTPGMQFDVVASCGLIEHFRGVSLDQLLRKHDELLVPGGLLVIMMPNFTGLQYLWHYMFDKPSLQLHNVDSMQPATFSVFEELGYKTLLSDYLGQCELWGTSRFKNNGRATLLSKSVAALNILLTKAFKVAGRAGIRLSGQALSPCFLYVARKPHTEN